MKAVCILTQRLLVLSFLSVVEDTQFDLRQSLLGSKLVSSFEWRKEAVPNLSGVVDAMHWKTAAILQTEDTSIIDTTHLNSQGISMMVYTINPSNVRHTLKEIHDMMFPDINVIVTLDSGYLSDFIMMADIFDKETKHTTDFQHHSKFLIVCNQSSFLNVDEKIHSLENVAVILPTNETSGMELHMTLKRHPHGSVFAQVSDCGVTNVSLCYFPNMMYGYNKRRLRVMMLPSDMYIMKYEVNGTMRFKGYAPDILNIIAKKLNFSYTVIEPQDMSWGLLQNGTWDGIVSYLQNKEIDLSACDLTIHEERAKVIDYIYPPINTDRTTVVYKLHRQSYLFLLTRPLQSDVYLTIFVVTIVVFLSFKYAENHGLVRQDTGNKNLLRLLFLNCASNRKNHIGRALFRQGTADSPDTAAGKVLLSSWWLFVIIMTSAYCANLVASFSTQKDIRPFSTLEELLDSDFGVGMRATGITTLIFQNSELPELKRLWNRINEQHPETLKMDKFNHVEKTKREQYAYITYRNVADMLMADHCDLDVLDDDFTFELLAFAVPKHSPLKKDIERVMSGLKESGILDILWNKWFKTRNSTMCTNTRKIQPISLRVLGGGGIIAGAGICLACIALVWERLRCPKKYC